MIIKKYYFIVLIIALLSCHDGFYDYYGREDLWRLPLVEPYELFKIAGATEESMLNNWHLNFKTLWDSVTVVQLNVSMINVNKNIIYGYGTENPGQHFIINTGTGEEKIYEDINEWERQLHGLDIDHKKIYNVYDLFEKFRNENILTWRPKKSP